MATLESIEALLISLTTQVVSHVKEDDEAFREVRHTFDGSNGNPGVKIRLDRIEQREANRSRHLWAMWVAIVTSIIGVVFSKLAGVLCRNIK